jgi:hypothetical protein
MSIQTPAYSNFPDQSRAQMPSCPYFIPGDPASGQADRPAGGCLGSEVIKALSERDCPLVGVRARCRARNSRTDPTLA